MSHFDGRYSTHVKQSYMQMQFSNYFIISRQIERWITKRKGKKGEKEEVGRKVAVSGHYRWYMCRLHVTPVAARHGLYLCVIQTKQHSLYFRSPLLQNQKKKEKKREIGKTKQNKRGKSAPGKSPSLLIQNHLHYCTQLKVIVREVAAIRILLLFVYL